jgi:hypothetical protein
MAVSVRMDPLLEQDLARAAKRQGITKSQFIVNAVEQALGHRDSYSLLLKAHKAYGLEEPTPQFAAEEPLKAWGALRPAGDAGVMAPESSWRSALQAKHDASMKDWLAYHAAKDRGEVWVPDELLAESAAAVGAVANPAASKEVGARAPRRARAPAANTVVKPKAGQVTTQATTKARTQASPRRSTGQGGAR